MNGDMRHLSSISSLRWRQDSQRIRPVNRWYRIWTITTNSSLLFLTKRFEYFLRCDWYFINSDADCVINGVGHGRRDGQKRSLTYLFCSERPIWVGIFNQIRFYIAHFHRCRTCLLYTSDAADER